MPPRACPGLLRQGEWNPPPGAGASSAPLCSGSDLRRDGAFSGPRGACVSPRVWLHSLQSVFTPSSRRPWGLATSLVFRDGDGPVLRRLVMLHAGAGTLVTPALGSVVSRWGSAPPARCAACAGDRDEGQVVAFYLPRDHRLRGLAVGACSFLLSVVTAERPFGFLRVCPQVFDCCLEPESFLRFGRLPRYSAGSGVAAEEMGKSSRTRGRHPGTSPVTSLAGESPTFLSARPLAHLSTETF